MVSASQPGEGGVGGGSGLSINSNSVETEAFV